MPSFINLQGQSFGRLKALKRHAGKAAQVRWLCQCECGKKAVVDASKLRSGHTQSCGCLQQERASAANKIHGHSSYPNNGRATKEYNTWALMHRRCKNSASVDFHLYGGRGIAVCAHWDDFENFFADVGPAPSKLHSIDRIDPNGPYSPENCRWADQKTQNRNRRITVFLTHDGVTRPIGEWSEITGLNYKLIHARIKRGLQSAEVLKPVNSKYRQ